ncbi:energy transducer TonB [Lysobacter sp. SG-8]|uniref:Energy transducer TonB n=1 Tax=Marilutibacter penaei TaxID=2759900 RepID=A0A7W3U5P8_9GAMM|nr:energy transducer TonB [Lysobacter penaei]MBB1089408.1 energy transducer TonB [Lysobacter penaei]
MSPIPTDRFGRDPADRPDFHRVIAQAGVLVLHAAALMLLLTPARIQLPEAPTQDLVVVVPPPILRPPAPPVEVSVTPPRRTPPSRPLDPPRVAPVDTAPVFDTPLPLDLPALDATDPLDAPAAVPDLSPMAGATLAYASAPPPPYPGAALRAGRSGRVLLEVTVGADGHPVDVRVVESSGHRDLDRAATRQVLRHWRFRPAMRDGHAVTAIGRVPVDFRL